MRFIWIAFGDNRDEVSFDPGSNEDHSYRNSHASDSVLEKSSADVNIGQKRASSTKEYEAVVLSAGGLRFSVT